MRAASLTYDRARRAVMWLSLLWFFVRPALADGPPMHGPLLCDPVCVAYFCAARCSGDDETPQCYAACIDEVSRDCKVCGD